ncbi:unnamed protein product [Mytilus coruscus]|uniref:Death domain-containing protein n=1 Tax=Mytilus coruscus TaxID=42192 RepID=A0A6J8C9Z5_MYTCO|nr:unnamed protein product [Mytilus coruscus]
MEEETPELILDFISSKLGTSDIKFLGIHLGLDSNDLETISCDYKNTHEVKFQTLWKWYSKTDSSSYIERLTSALISIENRLAADELNSLDVKQLYFKGEIPIPSKRISDKDLDFLSAQVVTDYQRIARFLGMRQDKLHTYHEKYVKDQALRCLKGCNKMDAVSRKSMCHALNYAERQNLVHQLVNSWNKK